MGGRSLSPFVIVSSLRKRSSFRQKFQNLVTVHQCVNVLQVNLIFCQKLFLIYFWTDHSIWACSTKGVNLGGKTNNEAIRAALKETLRYGLFVGTYAGVFCTVDETIAAIGGCRRFATCTLNMQISQVQIRKNNMGTFKNMT